MSEEEKSFNIKIGVLKDIERKNERRLALKNFVKTISRLLLIILGIIAIITTCLLFYSYVLRPNPIIKFTQYSTSDKGVPTELIFERVQDDLYVTGVNVKTGLTELERTMMYTRNEKIVYFDQNTGAMYFGGTRYSSWREVFQETEQARNEHNVSRKKIELERGVLFSDSLTRTELVWLMFHSRDYNKFNFNSRTFR